MTKIRRALLSCHDKTGIVELARLLERYEVEIISTSGTLALLRDAGISAVSMADYTGVPELLDGRVKSLHPGVHAGLLGNRDNKLHVEQLQAYGWDWIDLVVINLQPVADLMNFPGITAPEVLDQTDIGGAAMIRSAAKNFRFVTVAVNPESYPFLMHELRAHDCQTPYDTRFRLACEAFACVSAYDTAIANFLRDHAPTPV